MASGKAPTPNPGNAALIAEQALVGAAFLGIIVPVLQYIAWTILVDIPTSSEVLSQPPHAWVYLVVLGLFPPLIIMGGLLQAKTRAGMAGVLTYGSMVIFGQRLLNDPVFSVISILGLMLALFFYLIGKAFVNRQNNQGGRGGMYR